MVRNPVSAKFVQARLEATPLSEFPGELPQDLAAAYAIQDESILHWSDEVVGWKVGGIPAAFVERFGEDRLAGPVFKSSVTHTDGDAGVFPVFDGGFVAVEGEIVFQLDRDIQPGAVDPSSPDVYDIVADAFIGVELASSPLSVINKLGPLSIISDFGNNAGLIVGERIDDWRNTLTPGRKMRVTIDGAEVGQAGLPPLEQGAIGALRFLLRNCASREITLRAGTYITTGAVTGVHETRTGSTSSIEFDGATPIHLILGKCQPFQ